ncbi:glycosyltransferase involved in cell wall biosynthesis [Ancylobacter aquaticus]|uniref:Glycosyltransferase involved in cell wall biosynthesis n=1 Tax=Ancylobacter aquaticus TaxID=100 RepID=A0A4V2PGG1_ANCAQ|nr:glycosyltransferase [Ancylobacter aquaticus]TCK16746.1 glycosyltransferase involved in cell wall biosynthesis [Ancylobacter aquaticus]
MIAILLPDLRGGGAERVSVDLARALAGYGHRVEFVLMRAKGDFLAEARREFTVADLDVRRTAQVPRSLARYLRERQPDALIANLWPLTCAAIVGRLLARYRRPVLLVDHNALSRQYAAWGVLHGLVLRASMIATYRCADAVAGVSEGVARDIATLSRMPASRVAVLHNPIPRRAEPAAADRQRVDALWGGPAGARVLSVGSYKKQKNHALLLNSFASLARNTPESRLMLLGQGENEPKLRALAAELGLADRVVFAGFHADPSPFFATADLFALSSDHEGFGNVLVEALSFGLPVVSTDCPSGPAEILDNGRFGTLVPVGDAPALARAMEAALREPVDRTALKRRAAAFWPEIAARNYLEQLGLT